MIVALDIDGTITRNSEFFSVISGALVKAGHKVIILTARDSLESAEFTLKESGIAYSEIITATMFYSSYTEGNLPADGWKGKICSDLGVNVLFDDSIGVIENVDPKIDSFWVVDHTMIR